MNDPKREARKRLSEEERTQRLQGGGESMRAQLATEEAQRARRTGQEGPTFSGLTPQEEERRRMMGERMPESPTGMGETQQAQMAMWGREGARREAREAEPYHRTAGERSPEDLRTGGSGSYYYPGMEAQERGPASPGGSFGRSDYTPSGRPRITQEPTAGERMKETGGGAAATVTQAGKGAMSRTEEMGGRAWDRTKQYGQQLGEKTRQATGGAGAEDVATRAGESIGRGIRKVAAVGSGILAGLRRGVEGSREERERRDEMRQPGREMYRERPEERRGEMRESGREMYGEDVERVREVSEERPTGEVRQTEFQEVKRREQR